MIMDSSLATYHSIVRAKERIGTKNVQSAEKNIALARSRGKRAQEFSSWERSFLRHTERYDCQAIAYNNFCYIFSEDDVCITLYPLPVWFGKKKHFDGKERIRHMKKYQRYRMDYIDTDEER